MINKLLQIVAPHYCYGCAKVGSPLCEECKYDIADSATTVCIVCTTPTTNGICCDCHSFYDRAWYVGDREGALRTLIDAFKFERVADAAESLACLLDQRLPVLPVATVFVPVPTIATHIRQRGYDHTKRIATELGIKRSIQVASVLERSGLSTQRGKTKRERMAQANQSYTCHQELNPQAIYILIDDIVTTNATLQACSAELRRAGAEAVWAAVVARQPLDK